MTLITPKGREKGKRRGRGGYIVPYTEKRFVRLHALDDCVKEKDASFVIKFHHLRACRRRGNV